jgi:membrane-associated phospholipid phosphatase
MDSLKNILTKKCTLLYFRGALVFLLASVIFLLIYGKTAAFLSLNSYHPFWLNVFFVNYTFVGDGIFAICLVGLFYFYFKQKKTGISLLYSFITSGLVVQIIKNLIHAPRPKIFFESGQYLFFVDGITRTGYSSFPSGHTATAFAIATVFVIIMQNKKWQLPILFAAILVGYSRIYLAQHFLLDIIVGAIVGIITAVLSVYLANNSRVIKYKFKKMHRISPSISNSPSSVQPA